MRKRRGVLIDDEIWRAAKIAALEAGVSTSVWIEKFVRFGVEATETRRNTPETPENAPQPTKMVKVGRNVTKNEIERLRAAYEAEERDPAQPWNAVDD